MESRLTTPRQDAATVRRLRRGIGILGMALPFVLAVGNVLITGRLELLGSISAYYYTDMRDVFVGTMCAIGVFLICYRYDKADDVLSTLAGVLSIAVALLPATPVDGTVTSFDQAVGRVHLIATGVLFLLLAYFCFFVFTKRALALRVTARKRMRNAVYVLCGLIIVAAVGGAVVTRDLPEGTRDTLRPLFWCETAAILAFGLAWLVKSGLFLKDVFPDTNLPRRRRGSQPAASPSSPATPPSTVSPAAPPSPESSSASLSPQ